jgi:hypothetical protein
MRAARSRIPRSLPALLLMGALLAGCAGEPPPPAPATTTAGSPDATAYDAQPEAPVGTRSNSVAAESQQDSMPPLPPSGSTSTTLPGGVDYPVTANFVPGYPSIIEVQIRDRQPADEVSLVAPDGTETAAYQLDTTKQMATARGGSGPSFGVGVAGGSSGDVGAGIGIGFPLFGFESAPSRAETEVLTRARVRIPDTAAYRADWKQWIVRILFDAGKSTERRLEMAAPPPPL